MLFLTGLLSGALEINLNVEIDRLEAQSGKRFMNRAHGFWSVGFFVTALAGAGIRQSGVSAGLHMGLIALLVLVVGGYMLYGMAPAPAPVRRHATMTATAIAFPNWGLVPLCIIGFAAFLVEGAGIDWSAIYMRDVFSVAAVRRRHGADAVCLLHGGDAAVGRSGGGTFRAAQRGHGAAWVWPASAC